MLRITKEDIKPEDLKRNDIFVFGSNLAGIHGAGAAFFAYKYGLTELGRGVGLYIRNREGVGSYAIPTKGVMIEKLPLDWVKYFVDSFIYDVKTEQYKELNFYVTKIGCGLAGFKVEEIAPLFKECLHLENVWLPQEFIDVINNLKEKEDAEFDTSIPDNWKDR